MAGWGLVGLAVIVLGVVVAVGALRVHTAGDVNGLAGHATIWALVVGIVGLLLGIWDKMAALARHITATSGPAEDELAAVALDKAQELRAALIGAAGPADQEANVRFRKRSGRFHEVGGAGEGEAGTILEYYRDLSPRRLVVLGAAGAGKTVLALHLQVLLLAGRVPGKGEPIPVLISAAAYDPARGWADWLAGHLALQFAISKAAAAQLVRNRLILPIVDGLDEVITAEPGSGDRVVALVKALNGWMQGIKRAPVIVTARSAQYHALRATIDRATEIELLSMPGDEAAAYLRDQFQDEAQERPWRPVLAELEEHPDGELAAQLATPWRLTLALAAVRDGMDPASLLSPPPGDYARALDQRLLGGYIAAAVRVPGTTRHYPEPAVRRWLLALAADLRTQGHNGGSPTDLRLDQWSAMSGWPARLGHAAVSALPALVALGYGLTAGNSLFAGGSVAMLLVAAISLVAPLRAQRVRLRGIASGRGLRIIGSALRQWLPFGLLIWFANGFALSARGLWGGIGGWLVTGVILGVTNGAADGHPKPVDPRDVITADGRFRVATGLMAMAAGVIPFAIAARYVSLGLGSLALWALLSLTAAFSGVISGDASVWTRYHVAVVLSALRHRTPLCLGAFLGWAHQVGLLRVYGPAYQFRHRQLHDYLTSTPPMTRPSA